LRPDWLERHGQDGQKLAVWAAVRLDQVLMGAFFHFDWVRLGLVSESGTAVPHSKTLRAQFVTPKFRQDVERGAPASQADANSKTERVSARVQNNFPDAPDFLPKRASFERRNLQAADWQRLPLNEQGEGGENGKGMIGKGIERAGIASGWSGCL
jgi:hypothetical protein